jgi:hypothetical protein
MGEHRAPDRTGPDWVRPSTLEVTVVPGPRKPGVSERIAQGWRAIHPRTGVALGIAVALALAGVGAAIVVTASPAAHKPAPAPRVAASAAPLGITGPEDPIAQANRSPLRCLIITAAAGNPTYLRADLNRASPCSRYSAWVTAVLHEVDGIWRPVLVEGAACRATSIPAVVLAELDVCRSSDAHVAVAGRGSSRPSG